MTVAYAALVHTLSRTPPIDVTTHRRQQNGRKHIAHTQRHTRMHTRVHLVWYAKHEQHNNTVRVCG